MHLVNRVKEQYFVLNFQLYKGNKKDDTFEYHLFRMCALQRTFLTGESPQSALVVGRIQPRPRMSIARWNLKEGGGKSLV